MLRVKESFDKLHACQKYEDVRVSGKRSVLNLIQDNHGYVWTNEQAIVEGLAQMSPQEQTRYREDSSFRSEVDKKAAAALGWSHGDAGKAILERVLKKQNPEITVLEKLSMEAAKFNIDEGQVIRLVQQAFREHPEMRHAVTAPKNEAEKEFSQKFMKELKSCLDANEFARYAKPLLETGTLPIDVQNEMDNWFWHTDKTNLVKNIITVSVEQRELLLSADKTNRAAMELQAKVFGALDEKTAQFAKTVLKQGAYAPEDRLRSFVLGLSVSKEEALDLISGLANEQKQEIFVRYASKYGSNLSSDLMTKVKKSDRDQIEIIARSHTLSAGEQLDAVLDDHSFSRRGLGKFLVDSTWDGSGFQSDEARNLMVQAMRKASLQGTDLPAEEATKFSMRTLATIANFRQSKGKFGDAATDIAITALAVGGAYFTAGGSLSLLAKTSIAAAVGAAVKVGGKAMASGSDYDWTARQVGLDGGVGMIYGATTFLGSQQLAKALNVGGAAGLKAAELAQSSLTRMAGQGGAQLIGEGSEAVVQEGLTTIARDMLLRNSSKVPMEAMTALATQVATQGNEEAVKLALQISLAQALKEQGLSTGTKVAIAYGLPAASGGIAGGAAGTVRGASEWNPDLPVDVNLANVGKNAMKSASIGSLSALTFKVGTKALEAGYGALSQNGADQVTNPDDYILDHAEDIGIFKKQPVILKAIQVDAPTTIQTLEGPVPANSRDWILTGVKGEQWPVSPDIFARSYNPVAGSVGMFQKKPIEVMAVQIDRAMNILDPTGATYQGSPGDWLVIGLNGNKYFVEPEVFASTYGAVDQIAKRVTLSAAAIQRAEVIVGNASVSVPKAMPPNQSEAKLLPATTEPEIVDSDTFMKSVRSVYYTGVRRLTNQIRVSESDRLPLVRKAPSVRQTSSESHDPAPQ